MAISPISSVSFKSNYNQVNFEGKKKEHTHRSMTNTIKSIPVAALIAMSPLVVSAQTASEKVVATWEYPTAYVDADGSVRPSYMEFVSTDGDDETAEKLYVSEDKEKYKTINIAGKSVRCKYTNNTRFQLDTLVCEVTNKEYAKSPAEVTKKYYIYGPASSINYNYYTPEGEYVSVKEQPKKYAGRREISKDFYDWLAETFGDEVKYKTNNTTVNGDEEVLNRYNF